jgi:threonine dehydratase
VTLVEPAGGASLTAALKIGAPQTIAITDTFVDGAAVARIGDRTFEVLRKVSSPRCACRAGKPHLRDDSGDAEPRRDRAGTCGRAGRRRAGTRCATRSRADGRLRDLGREFRFRAPAGGEGTRAELAGAEEVLHPAVCRNAPARCAISSTFWVPGDNITRFEYLKKNSRNFGSVLIGIESDDPGNFDAMVERVTTRGFGFRDITEDEVLADFLI